MCKRIYTYSRILILLPFLFASLVQPPLPALAGSVEDFPGDWDRYPSYTQYQDFMLHMTAEFPGICRLDTMGQSAGGRHLLVLKITKNPDIRESEPAFYYTSTIHGNEASGFVLMLRLIDHLCRNYGKDELVTRLVDHIEIWINPLANPDGTYFEGDTMISDIMRKNLNYVDLNRNFPSWVGGIVDYEPETMAQMQFMESIHLVLSANFHGGAEVLNYPWDTWETYHADDNWYRWACGKYADTAKVRSLPLVYMVDVDSSGIINGYQWYDVIGSRQDYVNYFLNAREVTIEISTIKNPPPGNLPYLWYYNKSSLLQYLENCLFGIQGMVTDAGTGQPLESRIEVRQHDRHESHVFSDPLTGYFARLIEAGSWSLEFTAEGYERKILDDVDVEWDQATILNVELIPWPAGMDGHAELEVFPNPWVEGAEVRFQVRIPGARTILLTGMDGRLVLQDQLNCPHTGTCSYQLRNAEMDPGWYVIQVLSMEGVLSAKLLRLQWK